MHLLNKNMEAIGLPINYKSFIDTEIKVKNKGVNSHSIIHDDEELELVYGADHTFFVNFPTQVLKQIHVRKTQYTDQFIRTPFVVKFLLTYPYFYNELRETNNQKKEYYYRFHDIKACNAVRWPSVFNNLPIVKSNAFCELNCRSLLCGSCNYYRHVRQLPDKVTEKYSIDVFRISNAFYKLQHNGKNKYAKFVFNLIFSYIDNIFVKQDYSVMKRFKPFFPSN